ncbi:hypothetical protein TREMEDRAFT_70659 [Tremella mesenterica DSM 1558]|uniref:uncharacterized protein n=1 Tax=Tremella mesenterica (strain ATCC 24925 / CBS 8224 / DSM 1558 / NBRC 9311 / NRRL Y-6157 / RJB 2259-6 / UBC 559-6) TaxID=578456 RepID=UPI0003F49483|nr:uncharacterized protein TREMEDRAFT_70659 [Tremella mesenterica DSM 1558]EIW72252.1 hypothetical protein TREMEDRAFT_70659 [Tremella mesenterica DSM 1558]
MSHRSKHSPEKGKDKPLPTSVPSLHTPSATAALYNFRLLAALRSDDPAQVQPFLDELKLVKGQEGESVAKAGRLLAMAVRVAPVSIVSDILASPYIPSPNIRLEQNSPATALHVASQIGRADVVEMLLNHPKINDTIRDEQGRTALECAANTEIASLVEDSRAALQMRFIALLASYVSSPLSSVDEAARMSEFLSSPRVDILNLNALDERSGTSLLHEAARRRDLRLVELCVKRGADVFVRDKRGRRVLEGEKGADERIKAFLRQFSNQDNLVQPKSDGRPPDLRGFLSKWVNYRSGWRSRWFVLENGVLSYYRNREEESVACRGSIAIATASFNPSSDGSRFEISSRVSYSAPKIIVKSAHRAEIARWIQAIRLNLDYYSKGGQPSKRTGSINSLTPTTEKPAKSALRTLPPPDTFLSPALQRSTTGLSGISIATQRTITKDESPDMSNLGMEDDNEETMSIFEAADKESLTGSGEPAQEQHGIPHEASYDMGVLSIKAQLDTTIQLMESLLEPLLNQASSSLPLGRDVSRNAAIKDALRSSMTTLGNLISHQSIMSQDRERYLLSRINREVEARKLWEENMLAVAQQQEETDKQLTLAARDNEKKRRALRQAKGVLAEITGSTSVPTSKPGSPGKTGFTPLHPPTGAESGILDIPLTPGTAPSFSPGIFPALSPGSTRPSISNIQEVQSVLEAADTDTEDGDDEFFDAIETNNIPNLRLHESIAHPEKERPGTPVSADRKVDLHKPKSGTIHEFLARKSLEPYLHVRNKLPIDDDKRPSVSLWSILKSSVGKDLTKISFPVSFNECTSMLQRMAEDMEYDACLTVAAAEQDSLKRLAFVAAFAMSNYSSTIGRIAKPFNPLLSQSFEYAVPGRYRYISEQVSHHPPISACYSEAPTWNYYGEVDAQNKFQGRSFEIRPTGVAHAELIIPRSWTTRHLNYPPAPSEYESNEELVVEHYSWKKVTTNVSNFIMGTPLIDHYGDLVVTNHRTGETCTLTFKPRGWRGKDAFEIKGTVRNGDGTEAWDIAGRWDSQLIARQSGKGNLPLDSATEIQPTQQEYLLLWRNSEKPKAPFNLTPYAITLNDIPPGLKDYLCPTDCRLRTDQRAFENAEYDKAQELKTQNEEKQRLTRKLRAEGKLPPHESRWFYPSRDTDSGERVWIPRRTESGEVLFWAERERALETKWANVDHIFVEG